MLKVTLTQLQLLTHYPIDFAICTYYLSYLCFQAAIGSLHHSLLLWIIHTRKSHLTPSALFMIFIILATKCDPLSELILSGTPNLGNTSLHRHFATDLKSGLLVGVASTQR